MLKEKIYNSKGDGWMGLDKGAISQAEKAGNLIHTLDEVMKSYAEKKTNSPEQRKGDKDKGGDNGIKKENASEPDGRGVKPPTGLALGKNNNGFRNMGGATKAKGPQKNDATGDIDVIMLD